MEFVLMAMEVEHIELSKEIGQFYSTLYGTVEEMIGDLRVDLEIEFDFLQAQVRQILAYGP